MRIATWNVNSIKQRIENLSAWLRERQPDIVCLQETSPGRDVSREPFEALGYNVAVTVKKPSMVSRSSQNCRSTR